MLAGLARADVPGYSFKSLATLDSTVVGEKISGDFEIGTVNASGTVAFVVEVDGGEAGFLIGVDGKAQLLARPNNDAPGGGKFGGSVYSPLWVNDAGNVAMGVDVDPGDGAAVEILYYDKGTNKWTVILKKGMPAPGGGTFNGATRYASINSANDIALVGNVAESAAGPAGDGIFLYSAGKLTALVRPGAKVGGGTLEQAWRVALTENGTVAFEGKVQGDDGYGAYIVTRDGAITELATPKTVAPGGSDKFTTLRGPHANSKGDVAMLGKVGDNWSVYLYTAKDKKLTAIVKPGDGLPGGGKLMTTEGENYRHTFDFLEDGTIVFAGQLDDGAGIYLSKDGKVNLVARTGQEMKGVGTPDKLANKDLSSLGVAINSKGQIAFPAHTTDDKTHLVLATPVAGTPAAGQ